MLLWQTAAGGDCTIFRPLKPSSTWQLRPRGGPLNLLELVRQPPPVLKQRTITTSPFRHHRFRSCWTIKIFCNASVKRPTITIQLKDESSRRPAHEHGSSRHPRAAVAAGER